MERRLANAGAGPTTSRTERSRRRWSQGRISRRWRVRWISRRRSFSGGGAPRLCERRRSSARRRRSACGQDAAARGDRDRRGGGAGERRHSGSRPSPSAARGARGMIPQGARVLLRAAAVDFRKGPEGLVSLVRDAGADPFDGSLYVFRAKRADKIKIVWWDGSGLCLFANDLRSYYTSSIFS